MSDSIPYADIIILALIAGFILLRLRGVLGDRTGNDRPEGLFGRPSASGWQIKPEPVVQVDEKSLKAKPGGENDAYFSALADGPAKTALGQLKEKDPQFVATRFLAGARSAFEMVYDAFVKGDKPTLKMLLSDPIYQHFASEIDERDKQENKTETTLVRVGRLGDIVQQRRARCGNMARLTVYFRQRAGDAGARAQGRYRRG